VKEYQTAQGLQVDGVVGPLTRAKLFPSEKPEEEEGRCRGGWRRRWIATGSSGEFVKEVQQALKIPVDGFFGPQTEQAVKDFQTAQGLQVDGVVGPLTRAKLFPSEKPEEGGWSWRGGGRRRWIAQGSLGEAVKEVQQALKVPVDGFFGPQTEQAVKDFQTAQGLQVDGVVGPRTRAKLFPTEQPEPATEEKKEAPSSTPPSAPVSASSTPSSPSSAPATERPWLRVGAVGEAVKEVQQALGIHADGSFGRLTERAVKEFQFTHDLPVDGVLGPRTWAKLDEKKPAPDAAMQALIGMGFSDVEVNARLLRKHNGDLEQVVAEILGSQ